MIDHHKKKYPSATCFTDDDSPTGWATRFRIDEFPDLADLQVGDYVTVNTELWMSPSHYWRQTVEVIGISEYLNDDGQSYVWAIGHSPGEDDSDWELAAMAFENNRNMWRSRFYHLGETVGKARTHAEALVEALEHEYKDQQS